MTPKGEDKVILPTPEERVRVSGPSTVLDIIMSPAPLPVSNTAGLIRVTGPAIEIKWPLVAIVPVKQTGPVPF